MTRPSGADGGQLYARSLSVSARSVAAPPRLKEADPIFSSQAWKFASSS
jgi:hypothetical protein